MKKSFPFKKNDGFTLTEMVVAIGIFVLIIGAVYSAYTLSHRAYREGESAAEITQNGRVILERMTREIRQAKEIVTELADDEAGATSTIEFEDGHDTSFIHYIHYFGDDTNQTVKREDIAYYFYYSGDAASSTTYVTRDAEPPEDDFLATTTLESLRTIGEYVTDLKFWGSEVINISMTLEKENKSIHLRTKIFGRNL